MYTPSSRTSNESTCTISRGSSGILTVPVGHVRVAVILAKRVEIGATDTKHAVGAEIRTPPTHTLVRVVSRRIADDRPLMATGQTAGRLDEKRPGVRVEHVLIPR